MSEYLYSPNTKTGRITANNFQHREVQYAVIGDNAFFEGDIVLGKVADIDAVSKLPEVVQLAPMGTVIKGDQFRWRNREIPYRLDANFPNPERVTGAIAHWQADTGIKFIPLTSANLNKYPNRLLFISGNGCWSYVGMQGGEQELSLGYGCSLGNAIHEIGHAVGLWHEQSRVDRDQFITVNFENIQPGTEHNFDQHITDGDDVGPYDYGSIMHYPAWAFSVNGLPTIVAINGAPIGQRDGLSQGDIATVAAIYP